MYNCTFCFQLQYQLYFVSARRDSKEIDDENHHVPEVIPLDSLVPEILKLNKLTKLHLDQA